MKWPLLICALACGVTAYASKKEVWFLSPEQTTFIELPSMSGGYTYAQGGELHRNCAQVEGGYFHPQWGVHHHGVKVHSYKFIPEQKKWDVDSGIISCRENNYFDVFCQRDENLSSLTVWIDISSSLREIDGAVDCYRQRFIEAIEKNCLLSVSYSLFNTTFKSLGSTKEACLTVGLNNGVDLLQKVLSYEGNSLLVITDISEYREEFVKPLREAGVILKGTGDPGDARLFAKNLEFLGAQICRNN